MKDHKMKIIIILNVFFLFLMIMLRFSHFIPSWKNFFTWISHFLFVINIILFSYIVFQIGKVFWKLSKLVTICLTMLGLFYFSFILNELGEAENPRCNIDKITEYPIGKYPKTLFVICRSCTADVDLKIREGWLPIWESVNFVESDREHSQIIEISDQYGNHFGYDPIQNNFWHISK